MRQVADCSDFGGYFSADPCQETCNISEELMTCKTDCYNQGWKIHKPDY